MHMIGAEPRPLRIALAQFNSTVGDLEGNTTRIVEWIGRARDRGADLVVFPELAVAGYPPEDLLLKPSFVRENGWARTRIVAASKGIAVVCGYVDLDVDIYNAAFFAADGELVGLYRKVFLPNYGVFDEERYFQSGRGCPIFVLGGVRIGVSICEDCWYPTGPMSLQAQMGAELLVNINGSPYHFGKRALRQTMIATRAMDSRAFVAWVNMVGGQDELVFDGNSMIARPNGALLAHAPSFQEYLLVADLDIGTVFGGRLHDTRLRKKAERSITWNLQASEIVISSEPPHGRMGIGVADLKQPLDGASEVYQALVVGTRDYLRKSGFSKAVIGLSGGIDPHLRQPWRPTPWVLRTLRGF